MKKVLLTATLLLSTTSVMNATNLPTVIGTNNEQFGVQSVSGDGDCAFTAIGKSRFDVTAAFKAEVDANFEALKNFDKSRSSMHDLVKGLAKGTPDVTMNDVLKQVGSFIDDSASKYSKDPSERRPSVLANQALTDFKSGIGSFTDEEFGSAKLMLQSRILNMYYERYEAFQEALKQELMESGVSSSNLTTKAGLLQSIDTVFSKNKGQSSWLPVGLIFGVQERLGLSLAVWSSKDQAPGHVSLLQFSDEGSKDLTDPSVRHVVWNGGHYDQLIVKP